MFVLTSSKSPPVLHPSVNKLGVKLLWEVQQQEKSKNTVMSWFSLQTALNILFLGARGKTKSDMNKALGITGPPNQFLHSFTALINSLVSTKQLNIVSAVFLKKGINLATSYQKILRRQSHSPLRTVNCKNGAECAKEVNSWCSKNTHGKIKRIVEPSDFSSDALALVLNAIYFKAQWAIPFDEKNTKSTDFRTVGKNGSIKKVKVQMMKQYDTYHSYNDNHRRLDAKIIQLDYADHGKDPAFCMTIILPNKVNGIKKTLNTLKQLNLAEVIGSLSTKSVTVSLPKFKQELELKLNRILTKMGFGFMFSRKNLPNFRGISKTAIFVTAVLQKAVISVAENGTEAAAVTAEILGFDSEDQPKPYKFTADHPFTFFITPRNKVVPIFQGVVMKPKF